MLRTLPAAVAIGAFVASSVFAGANRLFELTRLARMMAGLDSFEARRLVVFGPWYASVQRIRDTTPPDATIDFVMITPSARDIAVLGGAELQPRDVRFFDGWDAWKRRERAEFLHDARAANAAPAPPPGPARTVVAVDPKSDPPLRIVR